MGVTSVRLDKEVEQPLARLASRLDRSRNYLINQAIKEYIARQSMEEQRWQDTLAALESVKSGNVVNESEVVSKLKSWGTDSS